MNLLETARKLTEYLSKMNVDECKGMLAEIREKHLSDNYWKSFISRIEDAESLTPLINELNQENILIKLHGRFQEHEWNETPSINMMILNQIIVKQQEYAEMKWPNMIIHAFRQILLDAILKHMLEEKFNKKNQLLSFIEKKQAMLDSMTEDLSQSQFACTAKVNEILSVSLSSMNSGENDSQLEKLKEELAELKKKAEEDKQHYISELKKLEQEHIKLSGELKLYKHYLEDVKKKPDSTSTILAAVKQPATHLMEQSWVMVNNDAEKVCAQRDPIEHQKTKNMLTNLMLQSQNGHKPPERRKTRPVPDYEIESKTGSTRTEFQKNRSILEGHFKRQQAQQTPESSPSQPEVKKSLGC